MYLNFNSHNTSKGSSSYGLIEYLEKENETETEIDEDKLSDDEKAVSEPFFDASYDPKKLDNSVSKNEVVISLDNNRSDKRDIKKDANFYMLNVSPDTKELKHMEKIAIEELKKRGLKENKKNKVIFEEQKDELMKMQMKLYVNDLMEEYVKNFDREIPIDEKSLPPKNIVKIINLETEKRFQEHLKSKGIEEQIKDKTETKSNWIEVSNLKIIDSKNNSNVVQIDIGGGVKSDVFIPKKLMQEQKNESYKIPENVYQDKIKEVINKHTDIELDYKVTNMATLKNGNTSYNFHKKDERFEDGLNISIRDKDLKIIDGKYYATAHLLNQKEKTAISNSINKNYGKDRDRIYKEITKEKGYNADTRPLTKKDLMYFGKIETQRKYNHKDKYVQTNKEILKEIEKLRKLKIFNKGKINKLESTLNKTESGKIIKEGMKKEGLQYHAHVLISRHDKTMKNPANKISLSPESSQKESYMPNGAKVGFDRVEFKKAGEEVFDKKFSFDREKEHTFNHYNNQIKQMKGLKKVTQNVSGKAKSEIKSFISKHTGISKLKQELSPIQSIKNEIKVAQIPTKLPTSVVELAYKTAKKVIDAGLGY